MHQPREMKRFDRADELKDSCYMNRCDLIDIMPLIMSKIVIDPKEISHCFVFKKDYFLTTNHLEKIFTIANLLPLASTCRHFFHLVKTFIKKKNYSSLDYFKPSEYICPVYSLLNQRRLIRWSISCGCDMNAIASNASANGNIHLMKWLIEDMHVNFTNDEQCCPSASTNGRVDALKYLHEELKMPLTLQCSMDAIDFGQVEVLEYLVASQTPICPKAYSRAAYSGKINVLEFLKKHNIPCKTAPMEPAADNDQVNCMEWLFREGYTITDNVFYFAIRKGRINVLKWIRNKFNTHPRYRNALPPRDYDQRCILYRQWDALIYGLEHFHIEVKDRDWIRALFQVREKQEEENVFPMEEQVKEKLRQLIAKRQSVAYK